MNHDHGHSVVCHSCLEPVSPAASKCPHCLADLAWGGADPHSSDNSTIALIFGAIAVFATLSALKDLFN
jgi:hypothetical protein